MLLFDGIERIEIAMRTKMIYFLSLSYGPFWYRNTELFRSESAHEENIQALEREFGYSKEIFIKDHKERFPDQDPEAWKIIEVISMGTLSKYFNNLHHQLPEKAKITQSMGLNIHKELASWLEAVTYFRNIVAHHSRLYSRLMVLKPKPVLNNPQLPWLLGDLRPLEINRPFLIISVILYLCNAVTPGHHIKEKIMKLFDENTNVSKHKLGFLEDWKRHPIWQ